MWLAPRMTRLVLTLKLYNLSHEALTTVSLISLPVRYTGAIGAWQISSNSSHANSRCDNLERVSFQFIV